MHAVEAQQMSVLIIWWLLNLFSGPILNTHEGRLENLHASMWTDIFFVFVSFIFYYFLFIYYLFIYLFFLFVFMFFIEFLLYTLFYLISIHVVYI
jgi:hypothetical protein